MKCKMCNNEAEIISVDLRDVDDVTGVVRQHHEYVSDGTICWECHSTRFKPKLKSMGFVEGQAEGYGGSLQPTP